MPNLVNRLEGSPREDLSKISAELERQADIYRGLVVNKDVIMRLLAPRPEGTPVGKELIIPVVVLGRSVPIERQAAFAGIQMLYDPSYAHDAGGGITFVTPHLVWMQDGQKYKSTSVEKVRRIYRFNERGATQYDGIALVLVHRRIQKTLKDHYIDLPGTSIGSDNAPCLTGGDGNLQLLYFRVDYTSSHRGSATCWG
jgi:hypothetical protein